MPAAVLADPAPSYPELLRRSLDRAPQLLEQAAHLRAARAEARQARAWPNPSAGIEIENLGAPRIASGDSQLQTTLTITQPFELGGKRSARIAAGSAGVVAADARKHQVEVDYAAELALAYATAEAMQLRAQLAEADLDRAREDLRAAKALVAAGKEAALRAAQAQAGLSAATAARAAAAADVIEALATLSALAGVGEPYSSVASSLLDVETPIAGPGPERSPAVATAEAERDARAALVRVERTRPIPDVGLSGGVRRFGDGGTGLVVGLSATIPLFDRNIGGIAAAEARREAADQQLAAARLAARASRRSALAQADAARTRLAAAGEAEAAAAEAYRLARIGYDAGKTSLLELLILRRALGDARALTIDARLARVRALTALARADGRLAFGEP